ncbi:MAG TPA: sigma-54 dependent transcriptional regulator [Candidatus Krumholzibacteria bacterium]|nr:sigma-54 dependent transcriptional regulator [Candidatus Krumholzibacteria bacterium]
MKPQILIIDDQESILFFLRRTLAEEGFEVISAETGSKALKLIESTIPDLVLLDLKLPDMSGLDVLERIQNLYPDLCVVMMTAFGDVETAVSAMKAGAFDYVNKPINLEELLLILRRGLETGKLHSELHQLRLRSEIIDPRSEIVPSVAPKMLEIYDLIRRIAVGGSTTVLIEGESGTGKDVVANLIHQNSPRRDHAFLEINCASLPEELLESELFGHEKGAFTDAINQKRGLLELAHRGTLFLDEIGEMSLTIQVKLLRVLEKMSFRRVGGVKDIQVDVRIVSATNRDLIRCVEEGTFREDLYYRLKVIPLHIPPLRERSEDIILLAEHFLRNYAKAFHKRFQRLSPEAKKVLVGYPWPGNIRELKNMMERIALLEDGEELLASQVPITGNERTDEGSLLERIEEVLKGAIPEAGIPYDTLVEDLERTLIEKAFHKAEGNQSLTAKYLNINRDKLRYRMKTFELL